MGRRAQGELKLPKKLSESQEGKLLVQLKATIKSKKKELKGIMSALASGKLEEEGKTKLLAQFAKDVKAIQKQYDDLVKDKASYSKLTKETKVKYDEEKKNLEKLSRQVNEFTRLAELHEKDFGALLNKKGKLTKEIFELKGIKDDKSIKKILDLTKEIKEVEKTLATAKADYRKILARYEASVESIKTKEEEEEELDQSIKVKSEKLEDIENKIEVTTESNTRISQRYQTSETSAKNKNDEVIVLEKKIKELKTIAQDARRLADDNIGIMTSFYAQRNKFLVLARRIQDQAKKIGVVINLDFFEKAVKEEFKKPKKK